ncbi:MAG: cysteine hydrolase [Clostridia bacterium]|nr:cysteine hydrolase [Clostridia bacterium]
MKKALLIVDVQNEYFTGKLPISHPKDSFQNILRIQKAAREKGILTIVVQNTILKPNTRTFIRNSKEWQLHDEIIKNGYDVLIEKNYPGSFTGTNLEEVLKSNNIDTVIITGFMTQVCCDTTSRQAMHLGYSVEFVSDATGTLDFENSAGKASAEELHRSILVTQQLIFSKVVSTNELLANI